jgi:hypothetical protein
MAIGERKFEEAVGTVMVIEALGDIHVAHPLKEAGR